MKRFLLAVLLAGLSGQAVAQSLDFDERRDYRRERFRELFLEQHRYDRPLPNVAGCRQVVVPQPNGDIVLVHRAICHQFDE